VTVVPWAVVMSNAGCDPEVHAGFNQTVSPTLSGGAESNETVTLAGLDESPEKVRPEGIEKDPLYPPQPALPVNALTVFTASWNRYVGGAAALPAALTHCDPVT
jgi:hypothetical protein